MLNKSIYVQKTKQNTIYKFKKLSLILSLKISKTIKVLRFG